MSSEGPPLKAKRQQCYIARDAYFKCLDESNDNRSKCINAFEIFEKNCPKSWIKHFEKTRNAQSLQGLPAYQRL
ncbi:Cytochrome c oxidase assembly factor 6 [Mactra antiquata]